MSDNSQYVSCVKIMGRPILPPVMTVDKRAEMRSHRKKALDKENTLRTLKSSCQFQKSRSVSERNQVPKNVDLLLFSKAVPTIVDLQKDSDTCPPSTKSNLFDNLRSYSMLDDDNIADFLVCDDHFLSKCYSNLSKMPSHDISDESSMWFYPSKVMNFSSESRNDFQDNLTTKLLSDEYAEEYIYNNEKLTKDVEIVDHHDKFKSSSSEKFIQSDEIIKCSNPLEKLKRIDENPYSHEDFIYENISSIHSFNKENSSQHSTSKVDTSFPKATPSIGEPHINLSSQKTNKFDVYDVYRSYSTLDNTVTDEQAEHDDDISLICQLNVQAQPFSNSTMQADRSNYLNGISCDEFSSNYFAQNHIYVTQELSKDFRFSHHPGSHENIIKESILGNEGISCAEYSEKCEKNNEVLYSYDNHWSTRHNSFHAVTTDNSSMHSTNKMNPALGYINSESSNIDNSLSDLCSQPCLFSNENSISNLAKNCGIVENTISSKRSDLSSTEFLKVFNENMKFCSQSFDENKDFNSTLHSEYNSKPSFDEFASIQKDLKVKKFMKISTDSEVKSKINYAYLDNLSNICIQGFTKLCALYKGHLTRKLFKSTRVQNIIREIKDTAQLIAKIYDESLRKKEIVRSEYDFILERSSWKLLTSFLNEIHEIFFMFSLSEQLHIIFASELEKSEHLDRKMRKTLTVATLKRIKRKSLK